jgi:hypothetical protein
MIRPLPAAILLALLLTACGPDHTGLESEARLRPETGELMKAIALALPEFDRARQGAEPFKLIGAEQVILDGRYIWRMTFKATHLLPQDPSSEFGGLGGEIFVNVDLEGGTTTHAYGE